MTDKWAEHKQKFCGCKDASRLNRCQGRNNCELPEGHPERVSAAPRQPECEGLEVVAYQSLDATRGGGWMAHKHALPQSHIDQGALQEPLCRLSDHQRAIAELRDQLLKAAEQSLKATELLSATLSERDTLRQQLAERDAEIERLQVFNKSLDYEASERLQDVTEAENEAYTLRQQLAERDATIARLEAGIPRIQEQSHQMRQQRDKLAQILRDLVPGCKWRIMRPRIDAALAEIDNGNE